MGAVAELIKAAETKEAVDPSSMLERLNDLQERASSMPSSADSLSDLSKSALTTQQESRNRALKWLAVSGLGAAGVGALLRYARSRNEDSRRKKLMDDVDPYSGMPGREITIPIPHTKKSSLEKDAGGLLIPAAIAAATAPATLRTTGGSIGGLWDKAKNKTRKGFEHLFANTGSPLDSPWFLPAAVAATLGGGYLGYHGLDKSLERRRKSRSKREMSRARKEFEQALKSQFRQADLLESAGKRGAPKASGAVADGGFKFASAMGVVADAFAQAHLTGELAEQFETLEKTAEDQGFGWGSFKGTGRKALGGYLAALALLAAAGTGAGYSFVKSRERGRRKHNISKDILRRRALNTPPTVTVEPS